jgi:hypothetical protein
MISLISKFTSKMQARDIPSWVVWAQCICFFFLYSIWYYPGTNFLSDLLIIIGALLGIYSISINLGLFKTKEAAPFWLLVILLIWIIFHLLFLSNNFSQQLRELESIWKRVFIVMVYGLGFGIGLSRYKENSKCLVLMYLGMIVPGLIYFFKYFLRAYAARHALVLPDYIMLYDEPVSTYWIYKTAYTVALIPTFAIGVGCIQFSIISNNNYFRNALAFFGILVSVFVFDFVNIKNAIVYCMVLLVILVLASIKSAYKKMMLNNIYEGSIRNLIVKSLLILALIFTVFHLSVRMVKKNNSWLTLVPDAKIAYQIEKYDKWKYFGGNGFPQNELGQVVSVTNYYRAAWAIVGARLVLENPWGHGLVYRSFADLTRDKWPLSTLDQVHSGWLDLTLGIGIPGCIFLMSALLLVVYQLVKISNTTFINSNHSLLASPFKLSNFNNLFALLLTRKSNSE